jgi:hypothetical protein
MRLTWPHTKTFRVELSALKFSPKFSLWLSSKGQTINAEYYKSLLVNLKDIFEEKRKCRWKVTKGVLYLHDNAPFHRSLATKKKLAYLGFEFLDHLPYYPDLTLSI